MELKRNLNFIDIFFMGYGHIIGAGIYTLLGFTTKYGQGNTWISFILGGIISLMTGLSYANLSKKFDSNNGEYDYIKHIDPRLAKFSVVVLILAGVVTITTLAIALSNYVKIGNIPTNVITLLVIAIPTIINIISTKQTSNINIVVTLLETVGLLLLIGSSVGKWDIPLLFENKNGLNGIVRASFLTIFAFVGFESLIKLNKETINPKKNIPKGIIYSIVISTIIYIFVSISTISVMGIDKISKSNTPISNSINKVMGNSFKNMVNNIALISITSSILLTILSTSRQLQSISEQNIIPNYFGSINEKTQTPIVAIVSISILSYLLTYIKNVELSTTITNSFIFIIFTLVNLSSIIINYKKSKGVPIYSVIGLATTIIMTCLSLTNNYFST